MCCFLNSFVFSSGNDEGCSCHSCGYRSCGGNAIKGFAVINGEVCAVCGSCIDAYYARQYALARYFVGGNAGNDCC